MTEMTASCTVTIRPSLTAERLPALADAIIAKLWPDNRGGVVLLHRGKLVEMLKPLRDFVAVSGTQQLRVIREGMAYRFEPVP